jgi:hypothetical protein
MCRGFEFLFNNISRGERGGCKRITQWFKKAFPTERTEEFFGRAQPNLQNLIVKE